MPDTNLLQNIYLFKGLSQGELDTVLPACSLETVMPGDDVFTQGDVAEAMYVIKFGSIKIHQKASDGDHIEIATLGTGSHFGEMPMLDAEERSASATASEKTQIVKIAYDKLKAILADNPSISIHFYRELAKFLAGRLRVTTNDLSFAREKNLSHF